MFTNSSMFGINLVQCKLIENMVSHTLESVILPTSLELATSHTLYFISLEQVELSDIAYYTQ